MSEYKRHQGKLYPLCKKGDNLEEVAWKIYKKIINNDLLEKPKDFSAIDFLREDAPFDKYLIIDGVIYENDGTYRDHDYGMCKLKEHPDGTIDYEALYYDGGTDLAETIEDELLKNKASN